MKEQTHAKESFHRDADYWDDQRDRVDVYVDGLTVAEVCRKHGISPASFYKLKAKYGGMDVSDARRLKQLEDENAKLKRLVADTMLDVVVLKDLLGKR